MFGELECISVQFYKLSILLKTLHFNAFPFQSPAITSLNMDTFTCLFCSAYCLHWDLFSLFSRVHCPTCPPVFNMLMMLISPAGRKGGGEWGNGGECLLGQIFAEAFEKFPNIIVQSKTSASALIVLTSVNRTPCKVALVYLATPFDETVESAKYSFP